MYVWTRREGEDQMPIIDLTAELEAAVAERVDGQSGRLSEIGEDAAENAVLTAMCDRLGVPRSAVADWAADDAAQSWVAENGIDYIKFCLSNAGVATAGALWMEAAGILRYAGKI